MRLRHTLLFVVPALALSAQVMSAHHSFSAVYDASRTTTVQGVVTEFRLINPHAMMSIDVTDETGKVVKWTIEFAGRLNLTEGGWTERSIVPGERVSVTGNPTHTASPRLAFVRLVRADGSQLVPPGADRVNAIEEQRKQRARERNQPK